MTLMSTKYHWWPDMPKEKRITVRQLQWPGCKTAPEAKLTQELEQEFLARGDPKGVGGGVLICTVAQGSWRWAVEENAGSMRLARKPKEELSASEYLKGKVPKDLKGLATFPWLTNVGVHLNVEGFSNSLAVFLFPGLQVASEPGLVVLGMHSPEVGEELLDSADLYLDCRRLLLWPSISLIIIMTLALKSDGRVNCSSVWTIDPYRNRLRCLLQAIKSEPSAGLQTHAIRRGFTAAMERTLSIDLSHSATV